MEQNNMNTALFRINTIGTAEPILAMAFVNMQPLDKLYTLEDAFEAGTLFKNLNKPYLGGNVYEKWAGTNDEANS